MKIGGKSSLNPKQIASALENSFDRLEVALFPEDLKDLSSSSAIMKNTPVEWYSLHMPHHSALGNKCCLGVLDKSKRNSIMDTFRRTIQLADTVNPNAIVVIHVGEEISVENRNNNLSNIGNFLEEEFLRDASELRDFVKSDYPGIKIALEHCPPLAMIDGRIFYREYGIDWTYMPLLRKMGFDDVYGATLDFAHASYFIEFMGRHGMTVTYQDFFDGFGDNLLNIHFANPLGATREIISTEQNHSWGFKKDNPKDMECMEELAKLMVDNKYSGNVTVEIQLENYNDCTEVRKNADLLETALREFQG